MHERDVPGRLLFHLPRLGLLGFLLLLGLPIHAVRAANVPVSIVSWLRIDPAAPNTIYVGGLRYLPDYFPSYAGTPGPGCQWTAARSRDGGATWQSLPLGAIGYVHTDPLLAAKGCGTTPPFVVGPGSHHLFYVFGSDLTTVSTNSWIEHSADGGLHWTRPLPGILGPNVTAWTQGGVAISPVAPNRVYAYFQYDEPQANFLVRSDDGGAHFHYLFTDPQYRAGAFALTGSRDVALVTDPTSRDVVYLGLGDLGQASAPAYLWVRSTDGGKNWQLLLTVPHAASMTTLASGELLPPTILGTDRHLPGLLVAEVRTAGVPTDRRYASSDHGTTWRAIACPGDLHGICPTSTLENVFGAGRSYGFYPDGIHAFRGAGPAGPRLAVSGNLPCSESMLLDAEGGGSHTGEPAYLVCKLPLPSLLAPVAPPGATLPPVVAADVVSTAIYRTTDGHTWQRFNPTTAWQR